MLIQNILMQDFVDMNAVHYGCEPEAFWDIRRDKDSRTVEWNSGHCTTDQHIVDLLVGM